jgi:ABC-2 type transport system ATP-binding protein
MTTIRTRGLRRTFGGVTAVAGLDLNVGTGEIFGLVGPDGAGKTTTLRMLTGILPPTAGNIEVAGCDVVRHPDAVKDRIGYLSQRFGLYPDLTVAENIAFHADLQGVPAAEMPARTARLLGFSGLDPFRRRRAGDLSGGMKQKLGLACALVHTPRVLFLDEPTNGVDPVSRRDFWRILHQLVREGVTILVSTSYLDEAERCSRLALLHEGRVLALGTPGEVKRLLPGAVLEVRAADPRRAANLLRERLPETGVALFGDRIHVTTPDATGAERRIAEALAADGLPPGSVRAVEPSLEDVFVAVLAHPARPDSAAGAPSSR